METIDQILLKVVPSPRRAQISLHTWRNASGLELRQAWKVRNVLTLPACDTAAWTRRGNHSACFVAEQSPFRRPPAPYVDYCPRPLLSSMLSYIKAPHQVRNTFFFRLMRISIGAHCMRDEAARGSKLGGVWRGNSRRSDRGFRESDEQDAPDTLRHF